MERVRIYEILIVCLVSGFGMIYSGHVLDQWRTHNKLIESDPLWTMITPLLGLKGNLEMTLASRLSTKAKLVGLENIFLLSTTNIVIIQIQGILVGFGASLLIGTFHVLSSDESGGMFLNQFIRLAFIGILTSSVACLILGTVTIAIVYCSSRLNFDPDNIASPLAATLGDTVTLFILYYFTSLCPSAETVHSGHCFSIILILVILLPVLVSKVTSEDNRTIFKTCWFSIVPAMVLSSFSGLLLKMFVFRVKYLATFQPLINGIGGNVASILCSSMSTDCHKLKKGDTFNESDLQSNCTTLLQLLIFVTIFTHSVLLTIGSIIGIITLSGFTQLIIPYLCAVFVQAIILLFFVKFLVLSLWRLGIDPDNTSIPLATGVGDIIGTSLLCICLRN